MNDSNNKQESINLLPHDPAWLNDPVVTPALMQHYRVIPLQRDTHQLALGIADPNNQTTLTAISFHTGLRIRPIRVAEAQLEQFITTHCQPRMLAAQLATTLEKIAAPESSLIPAETQQENDEPIIEFVDRLLQDAIAKNVSDIHIEPYEQHCRLRFRCDGLLYETAIVPLHLAARIKTRLKIMANLNIAERRLPQDGRILWRKKHKIDIRASTCPTLFGEKIVLRLLASQQLLLDIDALGLTAAQNTLFRAKLTQPQGLILVTGPTGSGKTVTLYSALHYLNQIEKNILSVEDPVEIELGGINQVNINPAINLDFATILRTFLRQDPDIIMVGEIRDTETASIAMQAAQTGHLVLSTLHTNSALATITRLQAMGIPTYQLVSSISLIIAQRLVRKLCRYCRPVGIGIAPTTTNNCEHCHHGYIGRSAIFELMSMTEKIAAALLAQQSPQQVLALAQQEGMSFLWQAGMEKVQQGITDEAEMMRILGKNNN